MHWTHRAGRRARSRRHKAMAKRHPIRRWSREALGIEFAAMASFIDEPTDRVQLPDGRWMQLEPFQHRVDLATWDPPQPWSKMIPADALNPTVERYRVQPRAEGRLFYERRNRRYRKLSPVLVKLDDAPQPAAR